MDDLTRNWKNLSLTDKEDRRIVVTTEAENGEYILAASFLTKRVINMESVLRALKPLWRPVKELKARDMGDNKAILIFRDEVDLERVLANGPWSFDKHIVILTRIDDTTPFSTICFTQVSFWVQIHDLPIKFMKKAACEQIGSTLGMVEQAEDVDEGTHKGSFMRVRVQLDIRAPLCRGRKVGMGDQDYWVSFKYERLPNFCYWCGLLTHDEKECDIWIRSKGTLSAADQQYGSWLRGDSDR
jgi:hypothetical protein